MPDLTAGWLPAGACQATFAAVADVSTALTSSKVASALKSARRCFHRRPGTRSWISRGLPQGLDGGESNGR